MAIFSKDPQSRRDRRIFVFLSCSGMEAAGRGLVTLILSGEDRKTSVSEEVPLKRDLREGCTLYNSMGTRHIVVQINRAPWRYVRHGIDLEKPRK